MSTSSRLPPPTQKTVAEEGEHSVDLLDGEPGALEARLPTTPLHDPDEILERFLDYVAELGWKLYSAQEEALLEVMAGHHLILNTPTGSGKSLIAEAVHFRTLCRGGTSYYTSPIKALASEKFFQLCRVFGASRVGMLTGDASINPSAPLLCCTAEVLSNLALRRGPDLEAGSAVLDEFHYYSDAERGVAWQIPLIALPRTIFTLMSATLGNPAPIAERLESRSGRKVATVSGLERPVPLRYEYRTTPLQETIQSLADAGRTPAYVVSFTQRDAADLAGNLTSLKLCTRQEKEVIWQAVGDFRFDTPYGKDIRRLLGFGIGVHHAGLLPKYRLLVEQLAQRGLLRVISGTDTLGVGINIPIRTVLFRQLCKYDGRQTAILTVRDFQQIAGRAGRKGFDDEGFVVCQAPEHVIENLRLEQKARSDPKRAKKLVKRQPPPRGFVLWTETTFEQLTSRPAETLTPRFRIDHGILLQLLQQDEGSSDPSRKNFHSLRQLIGDSHEDDAAKQHWLSHSARLALSLYRAGILRVQRDQRTAYRWILLASDLQLEFALHQALSLFLLQRIETLDPSDPAYPLDLLSEVEAILEDPDLILRRQADRAKQELLGQLKAQGVEYEERVERLQEITWPKPNAAVIYEAFGRFRSAHPWLGSENIRPKGIGREMFESYLDFGDFVRLYGLQRAEGLLLRYLSQLFKTLTQTVPDTSKTDGVWDLLGFLRTILTRVDNSLIQEWENLLHPDTGLSKIAGTEKGDRAIEAFELLNDPRAFKARIRAELYELVRALAHKEWEQAAIAVWQPVDEQGEPWTPQRFAAAMESYFSEYESLVFTPEARLANLTRIEEEEPGEWTFVHTLVDPQGDNFWCIEGRVELKLRPHHGPGAQTPEELGLDKPLLRIDRIGS